MRQMAISPPRRVRDERTRGVPRYRLELEPFRGPGPDRAASVHGGSVSPVQHRVDRRRLDLAVVHARFDDHAHDPAFLADQDSQHDLGNGTYNLLLAAFGLHLQVRFGEAR